MAPRPVVLVTGCSEGGIGWHLCIAFAAAGCQVFATARKKGKMAGLAERGCTLLDMDVTDEASIARAVRVIMEQAPGIDVVVNNAGRVARAAGLRALLWWARHKAPHVLLRTAARRRLRAGRGAATDALAAPSRRVGCVGPLVEVPLAKVRETYEANVFGLLAVTQAVVPGMVQRRRGTVVNVASIVGLVATPFAGAYCRSKAAVISASDALRVELAPFGLRVVTVCPGAIRSHFGDNAATGLDTSTLRIFAPFRAAIEARAVASQSASSTPGDVFAAAVVRDVLRPTPPAMTVLGHMATAFRIMQWLPRWLRDILLARRFGLNVPVPLGA